MKKSYLLLLSVVVLTFGILGGAAAQGEGPQSPEAAQASLLGTAFTYQGQLRTSSGPVNGACDMTFQLFDAATAGNAIGNAVSKPVAVANGLFTVELDFGGAAFNGEARWVEVRVKCVGDAAFTTLTPRQSITPAPYALALPGLRTERNAIQPTSPNVIGGDTLNTVAADVVGAVVGGGGSPGQPNRVENSLAVVGGGKGNTASGYMSFIVGGENNTTSSVITAIGGGEANTASGSTSTIGGGSVNLASGDVSTIGGGIRNIASGEHSTIPGGYDARASHFGDMAYASGSFTNEGVAQTSIYVLRTFVPNNQRFGELFLNGFPIGGTSERLTIGPGRALVFDVLIVARTDNGKSSGWRYQGMIESQAAATRFIGTPTKTTLGEDDPAWDVDLVADDTNDALVIKGFSNGTGETIRFVATVRTVEVSW